MTSKTIEIKYIKKPTIILEASRLFVLSIPQVTRKAIVEEENTPVGLAPKIDRIVTF